MSRRPLNLQEQIKNPMQCLEDLEKTAEAIIRSITVPVNVLNILKAVFDFGTSIFVCVTGFGPSKPLQCVDGMNRVVAYLALCMTDVFPPDNNMLNQHWQ